jgi:hypothetical protein
MERFFDGMDSENSKTQGGKGQIKENSKKQEGKNGGKEKKKKEIFIYVEVSIPMCSPLVGNALGLPPSCDPPSGEPTLVGTSPTTKVHELGKKHCRKTLMEFKSY